MEGHGWVSQLALRVFTRHWRKIICFQWQMLLGLKTLCEFFEELGCDNRNALGKTIDDLAKLINSNTHC